MESALTFVARGADSLLLSIKQVLVALKLRDTNKLLTKTAHLCKIRSDEKNPNVTVINRLTIRR